MKKRTRRLLATAATWAALVALLIVVPTLAGLAVNRWRALDGRLAGATVAAPAPVQSPSAVEHGYYPYKACASAAFGGCHTSLASAGPVVSQRAWMSEKGAGKGEWKSRGVHSDASLGRCFDCHNPGPNDGTCVFCHSELGPRWQDGTEGVLRPHEWAERLAYPSGADPTKPGVNCGEGCHAWVDGEVSQAGFTNASGDPEQTTYRGTIRAGELLAGSKTAHRGIFQEKGCAGCHDPKVHGAIKSCIACHDFKIFADPAVNATSKHLTHIPLRTAEQPLADPENFQKRVLVCNYCHGSTSLQNASCWNCHLSGHDPQTPYWEPLRLPQLGTRTAGRGLAPSRGP
ncbi:MAG: hypothetical protein HY775_05090 [Acidobacteria bacterium]|nr:hypothetical protein [Acidobacteriota bacterium]